MAIACLVAPASATAAPFTLAASGENPHIAVDNNGTGHIVWNVPVGGGDDILRYCRLPRGATSCAALKTFTPIADDFDGPRVVLGGDEVILLTHRCCYLGPPQNQEIFVLRSSNGGQTFTAPQAIADNLFSLGGEAAFGPGAFQISTIGSDGSGTFYQAAPVDAPSTVFPQAQVDDDVPGPTGDTTQGSVAFIDPLTPMVAFTGSGLTYVRRFGGAGSYNLISNWDATSTVGPGDDPKLASGLRGLYLLYRVGSPGNRRLVVRRHTGAGFGPQVPVSPLSEPIFRDFIEDKGGNLHALWVDNDLPNDRVLYRRSVDGQTWGTTATLDTNVSGSFNLDLGAADDGGGWGVWTTASGESTIKAAPFTPVGPGEGGGCVPKVVYGKAVALAREGCFKKKGKTYRTNGAVRLNGLDLDPGGAGSATASGGAHRIIIDKGDGTLKSVGKVLVKAGNVKLDNDNLAWRIPKGGGQIKDLAGNPAVFDTGKFKVDFLGLRVSGQTSPKITGSEAMRSPIHLKLPPPIGGLLGGVITADATLQLDNDAGLHLDTDGNGPITVRTKTLFLGIAEVKDLSVDYVDDPFQLRGQAVLLLPVAKSALETKFGFRDGDFDYAKANLVFDDPGRPVSQFTFLKSIGFEIERDPLRLAGTASVTAGPTVLGVSATRVNGTVSYTFPKPPTPGIFRAQGTGFIVNVPTANVFAQYETSGKLSLGGHFGVSGLGANVSGSVDGVVDIPKKTFDLLGNGSATGIPPIFAPFGVKVLLSSKAAAGCGTATVPPGLVTASAGAAYLWSGGFSLFTGCNLAPFKATSSAHAAGATLSFNLPKGLPQADVLIAGGGGPPKVKLTGPSGQTLVSPEPPDPNASNAVGIIGPHSPIDSTYAILTRPQAGTWQVETLPGSQEIVEILEANGLAAPRVRGRVLTARGRRRVLSYNARRIAGQRIRLFEIGAGVAHRIGTIKGGRGRLPFSAADGPGGKRRIVAAIDSFGLPRANLRVTTYRAPRPIRPGRPRGVRARRQGRKLVIRWLPASHARRYLVRVAMKDGRRLAIITRGRSVKVPNVPGIDSARILVAGLKADNTPGPPARARLKAKPMRRGRRR